MEGVLERDMLKAMRFSNIRKKVKIATYFSTTINVILVLNKRHRNSFRFVLVWGYRGRGFLLYNILFSHSRSVWEHTERCSEWLLIFSNLIYLFSYFAPFPRHSYPSLDLSLWCSDATANFCYLLDLWFTSLLGSVHRVLSVSLSRSLHTLSLCIFENTLHVHTLSVKTCSVVLITPSLWPSLEG